MELIQLNLWLVLYSVGIIKPNRDRLLRRVIQSEGDMYSKTRIFVGK